MIEITDAFVAGGFNARFRPTGVDEELEDEWARLEAKVIPAMRAVADGAAIDTDTDAAIKTLIAVHFARSFEARRIFDEITAAMRGELLVGADLPKLRRAFAADFGRVPTDAEIEAALLDRMGGWLATNEFFVERMVYFHNKLLDFLAPKHLQVLRTDPGPVEFITGDVPVVRATEGGAKVNVAVMDSDIVYFPIGRWCAVALATKPLPSMTLVPADVVRCNDLVWRAAQRFVACHPDANWRRSCGLLSL